jgi:uncharacterized protein with von Willebrand factor type A (vWA) domain
MKNRFNTLSDIHTGGLPGRVYNRDFGKTGRVFKSTRLENEIFRELLAGCDGLRETQADGAKQLASFPELTRDVFTAFYALFLRREDEDALSEKAKRFNKPILEDLLADSEWGAVKQVCEGRELPAFEAAESFCAGILEKLPELLNKLGGGSGELLKVIDHLSKQLDDLGEEFQSQAEDAQRDPALEKKAVKTANRMDAKLRQIQDLEQTVRDNLTTAGPLFKAAVSEASKAAQEKAREVSDAIKAWGDGSGGMGNTPVNRDLLQRVRSSEKLTQAARMLGRYRDLIAGKRKNGFAYGLGEKYDITLGDNINLCLPSELALLATPETQALFLRKYRQKGLKQYRKREAVTKGMGDMIVCVDESGSMTELLAWAKAFALALLDIAARDHRRFALIHFASKSEVKTDLFLPGEYAAEDVFAAAEHNYDGSGTDFESPLNAVLTLIEQGFERADAVFITDGECAVTEAFAKRFSQAKQAHGFEVTGVLMDKDQPNAGTSLLPFSNRIFRSSELTPDAIARAVILQAA